MPKPPHAAHSAFTHGIITHAHACCFYPWNDQQVVLSHSTTPNLGLCISPLEAVIRTKLIPALTVRPPPNDSERKLQTWRHGIGQPHSHVAVDPGFLYNMPSPVLNVAFPLWDIKKLIRDLTAKTLTEVCSNVTILNQSCNLSLHGQGESLTGPTSNTRPGARLHGRRS